MGRSIRSKRALMLRAAKAAALDDINTARIQSLNDKLTRNVDIQNGVQPLPDNVPEHVTVHDIDSTYKLRNFVDLRANNTMSTGSTVVVAGHRAAQQIHVHPSVGKLREELKPMRYRPEQFSYYISPTESRLKADTYKSHTDHRYSKATIEDDVRQMVENEDKDDNVHVKTRNIKKRVRDDEAMEIDNQLGRMLGNTQYIDKYGGKLDGNVLPERKRQKTKLKAPQKRMKKVTDKRDVFRLLGKYSGRGKM